MSTTAPSKARHNVNFITGNAGKLREVKAILEPAIQVDNQTLDLLEIQGTVEEVTLDKCRRAADLVHFPQHHCLNYQWPLTHNPGRRPCSSGRHMPLLQRPERAARSLHVMSPLSAAVISVSRLTTLQ